MKAYYTRSSVIANEPGEILSTAAQLYETFMGGARNLKLGEQRGARVKAQGAREIAVSG